MERILEPHKLSSVELDNLKERRNTVILDPVFLDMEDVATVYRIGEETGLSVLQREYDITTCPFDGMFNFNDGEYIGDKEGLSKKLMALFESFAYTGNQEEIDAHALL